MIVVMTASAIVGSSRCMNNDATGRLEKIDTPKSPRSALPIHRMNCSWNGRSSPSLSRIASICSGVA